MYNLRSSSQNKLHLDFEMAKTQRKLNWGVGRTVECALNEWVGEWWCRRQRQTISIHENGMDIWVWEFGVTGGCVEGELVGSPHQATVHSPFGEKIVMAFHFMLFVMYAQLS